jgi:predicted dehydrogenase
VGRPAVATLRFGLVGTGFSRQHAAALAKHPRGRAVALCGRDFAKTERVAAECGVDAACRSYDELLARADVDAVAIITPPELHVEMTLRAFEAGKHVLLTKPFAPTLAEAALLTERAESSGLVHAVDQQLRFASPILHAKELIDAGAIGRPLTATDSVWMDMLSYLATATASPSKLEWYTRRDRHGGLLLAFAPHAFDRLLFCFGAAATLEGQLQVALPSLPLPGGGTVASDAPDSYQATIGFTSGVRAQALCRPLTWRALGEHGDMHGQRLEIHGQDGQLLLEGEMQVQPLRLASRGQGGYRDVAPPRHLDESDLPSGVNRPLYRLLDRFIGAALDGQPMVPSFRDGYRTQELIEALFRADATGRRQILPLTP